MQAKYTKQASGKYLLELTATDFYQSFLLNGLPVEVPPVQEEPTPIPPVVIPTPGISSGFEEAIRTAAPGKTIVFKLGTYDLPNLPNIPKGVSIDLGGSTIKAKTPGNYSEDKSIFTIDGGADQFIRNGVLRGEGIAAGLIRVLNSDRVNVEKIYGNGTKFFGIWARNCKNGSIRNFEMHNTSGALTGWASGNIVFSGLTDFEISDGIVSSDNADGGYGFKTLWPDSTFTNLKLTRLKTKMDHRSKWNNGQSKNIGLEIWKAKIAGSLEISGCDFGNQVSLAVNYGNQGKVLMHDNLFDTAGDTYAIETILDNLVFYKNKIRNTQMMFANFQRNGKWKNWDVHENTFEAPPAMPSWGGLFLIGADGVENVRVHHNIITLKGNASAAPLIKGPANGINIDGTNTIVRI